MQFKWKDYVRTYPTLVHFGHGSHRRHNDRDGDTQLFSVIRQRQGVISGTGRNHTP
jgi:hypothetical protein